jgi:hypothetical protein
MKHLTIEQLFLYNSKIGISSNIRKTIEKHLIICEGCREQLSKLRLRQQNMVKENQMKCNDINHNLIPFIEKELDVVNGCKVEEHLKECSRCSVIYESLKSLPQWDAATTFKQEIPLQARKKIESFVLKAIKRKKENQFIYKSKEKVFRGVEEFVNEITLILYPLRPEVAFRGEEKKDLKVIEHPGGDLQINTGIKNIEVQLTSIFEEFTVKAKTDKDGVAIFKNLKKGDFVSQVNGYQLDEMKVTR